MLTSARLQLRPRDTGGVFVCVCLHALVAVAQNTDVQVDFNSDILPILSSKCFACHGPDTESRKASLRLDTRDGVFARLENDRVVVVPHDPGRSELLHRIVRNDAQRMPPEDAGDRLTAPQIALMRRWIDQGAHWKPHWAFAAPRRPQVPRIGSAASRRNPIDAFVAARLSHTGLEMSVAADKTTLIRRVTLDLTGLPPTPQEVDDFVANQSPVAYERLLDRLLASPRYGERMAIVWLDAARYADTHGYLFDTERSMWRWRDWVIDALNRGQPFDEFTIEQLAGDLLPQPTLSQRIATGFHRNHLINNEAGAIAAEYLVENVVDRVDTTATVWMGLSLACCRCHDHKYDPFTQREYYQLYAFFNTVPELGLDGLNTNATPFIKAPTRGDRDQLAALQNRMSGAEQRLKSFEEQISKAQSKWEREFAGNDATPQAGLEAHWPLDGTPEEALRSDVPTVFAAAAAEYTDGVLGSAAALNGLGYLNGGDRIAISADDRLTVACWVRPNSKVGRMSLISRMQNAKQLFRGYALQLVGGLPALFLVDRFPDSMIQVQGRTVVEPDAWQHIAVTYDGSRKSAGVKLYLNGELQKPGVVVDTLRGPIATDEDFWIGNGHPAAKLKGAIDDVRVYRRVLSGDDIKQLPGLSIQSLLAVDPPRRNAEQSRRVREFYLARHASAEWRDAFLLLGELQTALVKRQRDVPTVMVMQEQKTPRETRLLIRGAYNKLGEITTAATPRQLPPLDPRLPKNRLGLARWLVNGQHPLTARVAVNRLWQMHFGQGLVATSGDFGVRGERPSHPQLLDWLATELVSCGWDVKALQKLILCSATYRQSSKSSHELWQRDPHNRLLARGPRNRLSAELIRDQALAVSGLLGQTIGGPSVRPYQPAGLWREVAFDFSGGNLTAQVYRQDVGDKLYRRSLYTFWKRTAPPPAMLLFDAPNRERCVVRREQTSTPLQALVLMNDPTYVEASRKLAERMMREVTGGPTQKIRYGFRLVTARQPRQEELLPLVGLFQGQRARFAETPELSDQLIAVGDSKPNESLSRNELAAYTIVCNVMLNLDECITKR